MDISKIFPITQLYQGDTWRFSVSAQDYDPSLWTITYVFRKVGQAAFSISSANVDNAFSFEVLPAVSAAYTPGLYSVSAVLSNLAGIGLPLDPVKSRLSRM